MLLKNQSNKRNLLKYLLLIPVAGVLFWGISCENKENSSLPGNNENWGEETVNSLRSNQKGKEMVAAMSGKLENRVYFMNAKSKEVYTQPDKGPSFKGSEGFQAYLNKKIQYPEDAKINNISGIVYAYFEIDRSGKVQNARIIDGIGKSFDTEVLEAVKNMPDWEPAYFMGKPLVMQLIVPVSFSQIANESDAKKFNHRVGISSDLFKDEGEDSDEKQKPFAVVDNQPRFPGGEEARMQYLIDNIEYPKEALSEGISGTVYVQFIIEADGSITNAKVLRGIGGGCDKEALDVIESMPDWEPGKKDGQPVRMQFNMPIRFAFSEDGGEK